MNINTQIQQYRALTNEVQSAGLFNVATLGQSTNKVRTSLDSEVGKTETFVPSASDGDTKAVFSFSANLATEKESRRVSRVELGSQSEQHLGAQRLAGEVAKKQAEMVASDVSRRDAVSKIYAEMWAEIEKNQAQRFQILMETISAISEIYATVYLSRAQPSAAHQRALLAVIVDAVRAETEE